MKKIFCRKTLSTLIAGVLMLNTFTFPAFAAGTSVSASKPMAEIYVSPDGDDNGKGTSSDPLRTVEGARNLVRTMNKNMTGDIIVYLRGGTYTIADTIDFTSADSATNGYRIIYKAVEGETPVISGGIAVTGWELHDAEKNIYKASVPAGHNFRQLYVNGERAVRAQNAAPGQYLTTADVYPKNISAAEYEEGFIWIYKTDLPEGMSLESLKGTEIHEIISWTDNVLRVKEATEDGDKIKLSLMDPEGKLIFNRPHPWVGYYTEHNTGLYPYYLANAYELIDVDGEWYLDRDTDTLYYKAAEGVNMAEAEVIAPKVETLMNIEGTVDQKIEGLTIEGLTFEHSNWTYPSDNGFVNSQSGLPVVAAKLNNRLQVFRASAAVHVGCTTDFRFEKNTLTKLGNLAALDLEYGTTDSVIKNNVITQVSGNGIMVARGSDLEPYEYHGLYDPIDSRNVCDGDKILNNSITYIGLDHEGTCGIFAIYPKNLTIANNVIDHVTYTGISVGYGWSNKDNPMSGNVILRNTISNHMLVGNDGGAIYTLSKQPNSVLAENYIYDLGGSGIGVYNDEKTSGYTIARNVSVNGGGYGNNGAGALKMYDNYLGGTVPDDVKAEVIKNAGIQEYLNTTDELFSTVYNVKARGTFVELSGYFNLNTVKSVVFAGKNGTPIEVPIGSAEETTVSTILCPIPSDAVAGPVFVRSADGTDTNQKELFNKTVLVDHLDEDFDEYDTGVIDSNPSWTGNEYAEIADDGTEPVNHPGAYQMLKLLSSEGGGGKAESLNEYAIKELKFDFNFLNDEKSFHGLYVSIASDRIIINPGFGSVLRLDSVAGNNLTGNDPEVASNTWYTCRFVYDTDGRTKVKIWERDAEEPEAWNISVNGIRADGDEEGLVKVGYHSPNTGNSVLLDNIVVKNRRDDAVLSDDFANYYEGALDVTNPTWKDNSYAEIISDETAADSGSDESREAGRLLKLNGAEGGNGKAVSVGSYVITEFQFDFYFVNDEVSYHGLYVGVGSDRIIINPAYAMVLRLDGVAGQNLSGTDPEILSGTWYTCKLVYDSDGKTKVKVWPKAIREPKEWNIQASGVRTEAGTLSLGYHSPNTGKSVYIDNVLAKGSTEYVLELPTLDSLVTAETRTPAGKTPALPERVTAVFSNGDTAQVSVAWDAVAPEQYEKGGTTFTVQGTVKGTELKAACKVSVFYQPEDVVASLASGVYVGEQVVELSCETNKSRIYYTTDGSTPTTESKVYKTKLTISETTVIKAVSYKKDWEMGNVITFTYVIEPAVDVTGVSLDKTELTLAVGETEMLIATVSPENATDATVLWSSSNEEIATVSDTGVVTALKAGTVSITASAGGQSATCEVTVISADESADDSETVDSVTDEATTPEEPVSGKPGQTAKIALWTSLAVAAAAGAAVIGLVCIRKKKS